MGQRPPFSHHFRSPHVQGILSGAPLAAAFSTIDEPHAWLIRGLVEYGWPDVSLQRGNLPAGAPGGIQVARILQREGREGLALELLAAAHGQPFAEDGIYSFTVQIIRKGAGFAVVVRCPEANFFQEFDYDPHHPTWVAGWIHQAITGYVPQFVAWRRAGGELTWSQRMGIPTVEGEPCSPNLLRLIQDCLNAHRPLHRLAEENWWLDRTPQGMAPPATPPLPRLSGIPRSPTPGGLPPASPFPTPPAGQPANQAPLRGPPVPAPMDLGITMGKGGGDPVYLSAEARAALARGEVRPGLAPQDSVQARARTLGPSNSLFVFAGLTAAQAIFWLLDALTVVIWYRDSMAALAVALPLFVLLLPLSLAMAIGAWQYRNVKDGVLPWVAIIGCALSPGCCFFGVPVAIWAGKVWLDPMVVSVRSPRNPSQPGSPPRPPGSGIQGPIVAPKAPSGPASKLDQLAKKLPW
jgi:hypothetical protein